MPWTLPCKIDAFARVVDAGEVRLNRIGAAIRQQQFVEFEMHAGSFVDQTDSYAMDLRDYATQDCPGSQRIVAPRTHRRSDRGFNLQARLGGRGDRREQARFHWRSGRGLRGCGGREKKSSRQTQERARKTATGWLRREGREFPAHHLLISELLLRFLLEKLPLYMSGQNSRHKVTRHAAEEAGFHAGPPSLSLSGSQKDSIHWKPRFQETFRRD